VGGGTVAVGVKGSTVGEGGRVAVALGCIGWKGVGVGEAFGAAVTRTKGRSGCRLAAAEAKLPHPESSIPIRTRIWMHLFMCKIGRRE
jgi:hypothetical protein